MQDWRDPNGFAHLSQAWTGHFQGRFGGHETLLLAGH